MPGRFFDSNTLIYVLSDEPEKRRRAAEIVLAGGTISVQVLNEVANVVRRKLRKPWPELREIIATFEHLLDVVPLTVETHHLGLAIAERHQLATYDSMVIASAILADCDVLFSEDMQDGMVFRGSLRIINPFAIDT